MHAKQELCLLYGRNLVWNRVKDYYINSSVTKRIFSMKFFRKKNPENRFKTIEILQLLKKCNKNQKRGLLMNINIISN